MIVFDYITHSVSALLVAYGLDYFLLDFNIAQVILFYLFVIIGALLPDIDSPKSFIGARLKTLSTMIFNSVGHRTMTHSIVIITIVYFLTVVFIGINPINSGIALGMIVHVLGDMLDGKVNIMWPINKYKIGFLNK